MVLALLKVSQILSTLVKYLVDQPSRASYLEQRGTVPMLAKTIQIGSMFHSMNPWGNGRMYQDICAI